MYKYRHPEKVKRIYEELKEHEGTTKLLNKLKAHHKGTYDHSLRVAKLSIDLALENDLSPKMVRIIGCAALLHDFGKSRIDKEILSKCGCLNKKELAIMEKHPHLGMEELEKYFSAKTNKIISSHHDFHTKNRKPAIRNRSAYSSQIVAAADMYDALISPRPYKSAYPVSKVKNIMVDEFIGYAHLIDQLSHKPLR